MTTIAFDGQMIAADTLTTDNWGMRDFCSKLLMGKDFVAGGAGNRHLIMKWWKSVKHMGFDELIQHGYPDYDEAKNCPSILIAHKVPHSGVFTRDGDRFEVCSREFHAIGSGQDYALAAMHLGKNAHEAVVVASQFDNNTGTQIDTLQVVSYEYHRG